MEDSSQIIWGVIFGGIGFGYFLYGKKQRAIVPLFVGITLCVFPYFVKDVYMLALAGMVLMAIPYFVKI